MPLDNIYSDLLAGGYEFAGKDEATKKRGLAIAMGKNQKFTHLPNDTWGLTEWYPEVGRGRSKKGNGKTQTGEGPGENGTNTGDNNNQAADIEPTADVS